MKYWNLQNSHAVIYERKTSVAVNSNAIEGICRQICYLFISW